jgi:hypothetical protein
VALFAAGACLVAHVPAEAQLGTLLSPGALTKAHAALEGISNCVKCHERGRRITAEKCLSCHKPVADRITRRAGVHRDVKGDCVACHVEHTGVDGELRPFDQAAFDHAGVAAFPLEGRHAPVAGKCSACHQTRSFLTARASCQSCHKDVHNGALGAACGSCHTTRVAFKNVIAGGRFDHSRTAYPLTGAHASAACTTCHINGAYKGLSFSTCTSCHKDRHQSAWGATCTACHTTETWRTSKIDHSRTAFPLLGRHAETACASCHKQSATRVKARSDTCGACHVDVHRGTFKQDCKSCHNENSFAKAPFDHGVTSFALSGKHAPLACSACHKSSAMPPAPGDTVRTRWTAAATRTAADFRGLKAACVSCHQDVHRNELGTSCDTCHSTSNFGVANYRHLRFAEFFGGQHASVGCGQCHLSSPVSAGLAPAKTRPLPLNVRFSGTSTACVACHKDVHLGQVGRECQTCHSLQTAKFAVAGFPHAKTAFPLTGKHANAACSSCHTTVTGVFPAGTGTAVRLKGVAIECASCHKDVHLAQVGNRCEGCHSTDAFAVPDYKHRDIPLNGFFVGRHLSATCDSCHRGTPMAFRIETRCTACHRDEHNGALPDCLRCHRP